MFHVASLPIRVLRSIFWNADSYALRLGIASALLAFCQAPPSAADSKRDSETPRSPAVAVGKRFLQDGKEVVINGMNYLPAYSSSIFPVAWLTGDHYRSEIVEEDLTTLQSLGVNLVSIQGFREEAVISGQDCANLHDFLGRAR